MKGQTAIEVVVAAVVAMGAGDGCDCYTSERVQNSYVSRLMTEIEAAIGTQDHG
jgi:hypothetical protein